MLTNGNQSWSPVELASKSESKAAASYGYGAPVVPQQPHSDFSAQLILTQTLADQQHRRDLDKIQAQSAAQIALENAKTAGQLQLAGLQQKPVVSSVPVSFWATQEGRAIIVLVVALVAKLLLGRRENFDD